jgi:hypothetical protein
MLPGGRPAPIQLSQDVLYGLWRDLADTSAAQAYRAIGKLVAAGDPAVALLRGHLRPVAPADVRRLSRLVQDLDHDRYTVRAEATR